MPFPQELEGVTADCLPRLLDSLLPLENWKCHTSRLCPSRREQTSYKLLPAMLVTLYVCEELRHGDVDPVTVLYCERTVVVVTPRVLAVPFPQELEGVTAIVPLFAPQLPLSN